MPRSPGPATITAPARSCRSVRFRLYPCIGSPTLTHLNPGCEPLRRPWARALFERADVVREIRDFVDAIVTEFGKCDRRLFRERTEAFDRANCAP